MDLYKDIMIKILQREEINVIFPNLQISAESIIETECYKALQIIKAVIEDDSLSDFECVEKIVRVFEEIGSNGESRHDFG